MYKRRDELEKEIEHLEQCLNRSNDQIERLIAGSKELKLKLDSVCKLVDNCSGDDGDCLALLEELKDVFKKTPQSFIETKKINDRGI